MIYQRPGSIEQARDYAISRARNMGLLGNGGGQSQSPSGPVGAAMGPNTAVGPSASEIASSMSMGARVAGLMGGLTQNATLAGLADPLSMGAKAVGTMDQISQGNYLDPALTAISIANPQIGMALGLGRAAYNSYNSGLLGDMLGTRSNEFTRDAQEEDYGWDRPTTDFYQNLDPTFKTSLETIDAMRSNPNSWGNNTLGLGIDAPEAPLSNFYSLDPTPSPTVADYYSYDAGGSPGNVGNMGGGFGDGSDTDSEGTSSSGVGGSAGDNDDGSAGNTA